MYHWLYRKGLLALLLTLTLSSLLAQQSITFQTKSGVETGLVNEVVAYEDGYFVLMSTESANADIELYISKFDNCHEQLWSKSYSSNTPLDFNKAIVDNDRLIVMAGTNLDYPVVIFLDLDGFFLSLRSYRQQEINNPNNPNIIQAYDGQYYLFGKSDKGAQQIKLDSNGDFISAYRLIGPNTGVKTFGSCILNDGTAIMRNSNFLARMDAAGTVMWARNYALSTLAFLENEFIPVDDGFVLMMEATSGVASVVKLDLDGEIVWVSRGFMINHSTASLELFDGVISIISQTEDIDRDLVLLELDESTGDLVSTQRFKFPLFNNYRFPEHAVSSTGDILVSGSVLVSSANSDWEDIIQINPQFSSCHEILNINSSSPLNIFSQDITSEVYTATINIREDIQPVSVTDEPLFFETQCGLPVLTTIDTIVNCAGEYFFEASHPGGTYLWTDGVMDSVRLFSDPGSYSLTVEGCAIDVQYDIEVIEGVIDLVAEAGDDLILTCEQASLVLDGTGSIGASDIVFSWQTTDGNIVQGADTPTPEIDQVGVYVLELFDSTLNCSTKDSVRVMADMNLPVADAGPDQLINCVTSTVELGGNSSASPDFSYSWVVNGGAEVSTESMHSVMTDGIYELMVTNLVNGCTDLDTVTIGSDLEAPTAVVISNVALDCLSGSLEVIDVEGGVSPFVFALDSGSVQESGLFSPLTPGPYNLQITGANGCTYDETFNVQVASTFSLDLGDEILITPGDSVQLNVVTDFMETDITAITWSEAGTLSCADCLDPYAQPFITTDYTVTVSSADGCVEMASVRVAVELVPLKIYAPDIFDPYAGTGADAKFTIYTDQQVSKVNYLNIYDRWGGLVFTNSDFQPNDDLQGWNGYNEDQEVESGVYVYSYELELIDGTTYLGSGTLTLIR